MAKQSRGFCKYCGKEYTKGGMIRHLPTHKNQKAEVELKTGKRKSGYFELVISDRYSKDYWLIVEIRETATLKELDTFIRNIWVECCGHLSLFEIDGVEYEAYPATDMLWGEPSKSMNYKLKDVCYVGQTIGYEYDYGSTTELFIKVQDYRIGTGKEDKIILLSRNNPLEILCSQCGKNKAQWIDTESYFDENPFWCEECMSKADDLDEEMLLPVCNSPRMGVCGYEGSECYPEQFLPDSKANE